MTRDEADNTTLDLDHYRKLMGVCEDTAIGHCGMQLVNEVARLRRNNNRLSNLVDDYHRVVTSWQDATGCSWWGAAANKIEQIEAEVSQLRATSGTRKEATT